MSALRELLATFDIRVDDEAIQKGVKHVEGFAQTLRAVGPILAEAFAVGALTEFVTSTVEAGARVVDLSNRLGIGTTDLQAWQFAARTAGVEAESAAHSLGFLNRAVGEAVLGGAEQTQAFQKLGITMATLKSGDTGEVLGEVADGLAKLKTQPERAAYAMKLFGREGQQLLPVLAGGREGLSKLREEFDELGGGMSQQFVQDAKKADDAIAGLKLGFLSLRSRIVGAMLPAVEALVAKVKSFIKVGADWLDHTYLLEHGLKALEVAAGIKLVLTLTKLAKSFGLLQPSIWKTLVALGEFVIPIALVALFGLAIEDLWTAIEGGDSVIGDVLTQLGGVEGKDEFVKSLIDAWDELKKAWMDIGGLDPLGSIASVLPVAVAGFVDLVKLALTLFHTLKGIGELGGNAISLVVDGIKDGLNPFRKDDGAGKHDAKEMEKDAESDFGAVAKDLGGLVNPLDILGHPAAQTIPGGPSNRAPGDAPADFVGPTQYGAPSVAPAAGHTINQKNEINVNVTGSKDAKATGQAVGQSVASELEDSNRNAADALGAM